MDGTTLFKSTDARAQLPAWVRPYVRTYENFGNVVRDVAQFFRVAQKLIVKSSEKPTIDHQNPWSSPGSNISQRPPPELKPGCGGMVQTADTHCARPSITSQGYNQEVFAQKAKVLDSHVPSLKRRRLNEKGGSEGNGVASLCIEYETEMETSHRRPVGLLDALEHSDRRHGGESEALAGEERANRLSTLSLQYEKRLDDELLGGKRKIKVVQERKTDITSDVSEEGKPGKARMFLAEIKKSLSHVNFQRVMESLQTYKQTDNLDTLLTEAANLFIGDANNHSLLRGFYQFIRPHHKKRFDEKCVELTGQGCGYKPGHSLSKDEKEMLMQSGAKLENVMGVAIPADSNTSCSQLNASQQLNKGGHHLGNHGDLKLKEQAPEQSAQKSQIYSTFITDVKNSIGLEKSKQLFSAIQIYKKSDNYESLVDTVVSLLTEKNEDFNLLKTFALFIRPQHKKQYKEMLDALVGDSSAQVSSSSSGFEAQQMQVSTPGKAPNKITSYFASSQRN